MQGSLPSAPASARACLPAARPEAQLAARDLACRRGDRLLFSGLSLALGPGEACQIAGANGIGKSSLIRLLAGLSPAYAGAVERAGVVGLIDERPGLDPALPLGEALDFWARIDGAAEAPGVGGQAIAPHAPAPQLANNALSALEILGLAELTDVPVRYLSTGQRKRAALARLLGQRADIWLLDEPLNGLDTAACALVEQLAAAHCAGGGLCVIASHQRFALAGMRVLDLAGFAP